MLGDLFYHLGTALGGLGSDLSGKAGAATGRGPDEAAVYDPDTGEVTDVDPADPFGQAGGVVVAAAAAWLVSRVLRPRPVSWPRVIIAGVAATFLADLVSRTPDRDRDAGLEAEDGDPEALLRRYATGIAMAAGYATLLYPRLPGPPLLRGLAFGALDVAAGPQGGLAGLAAENPALRFPLQALAVPAGQDAGPLAPLAFGLGLGLFYRYDDSEG